MRRLQRSLEKLIIHENSVVSV